MKLFTIKISRYQIKEMQMKSLEEIFLSTQKVQHGSVKCSEAERYVHALLDLSNEHSQAIYHLHKVKLYGSAFALLRSCFECYMAYG